MKTNIVVTETIQKYLALCCYMTLKINSNEFFIFADLRTAFDLLDRDQDGMVTPTELQFMLRNLGIHLDDELIDALMKEASKTGTYSLMSSVSL
jgi:Ca2+-binding EF-hand superfamily protein